MPLPPKGSNVKHRFGDPNFDEADIRAAVAEFDIDLRKFPEGIDGFIKYFLLKPDGFTADVPMKPILELI